MVCWWLNPLFRGIDLKLANCGLQGNQLSIQIGEADLVIINDGDLSKTGAHKGLDSIGTYAADSEDYDIAVIEFL